MTTKPSADSLQSPTMPVVVQPGALTAKHSKDVMQSPITTVVAQPGPELKREANAPPMLKPMAIWMETLPSRYVYVRKWSVLSWGCFWMFLTSGEQLHHVQSWIWFQWELVVLRLTLLVAMPRLHM